VYPGQLHPHPCECPQVSDALRILARFPVSALKDGHMALRVGAGTEDADERFGQLTDADLRYLRGVAFSDPRERRRDAEDIRNDALAKAYEKRETYSGTTHDQFIAWLAGYVVNFAKQHRKAKADEHAFLDRASIIADGPRRPGDEQLVPCADMIEQ